MLLSARGKLVLGVWCLGLGCSTATFLFSYNQDNGLLDWLQAGMNAAAACINCSMNRHRPLGYAKLMQNLPIPQAHYLV